MKARYLTFFSYVGTPFRSAEKLWLKEGKNYPDPMSVQGLIELGLKRLRSLNYPNIVLSSRTDGGVHALNASAHFDLERFGSNIYEPHVIVHTLNQFFQRSNTSILIRSCQRVNDKFSARYNAIRRTYLFRLAVLKKGLVQEEYQGVRPFIPIEEWRRCYFIKADDFDIERLKEGAKHFIGIHDFTTFKKFDKLKQYKHSRREIYGIDVTPGKPLAYSQSLAWTDAFDYWDIVFTGRAFVHNQIRRMMGTLICAAVGKLPTDEIKVMLQVPSKHSWPTFISCCPPDGLYLLNVEYRPEDLIYNPSESINSGHPSESIQCGHPSESLKCEQPIERDSGCESDSE